MIKFSRRTWIMIIAALAVLGAGVIYSCGSSKSSNPNYGGGGGGGAELNSGQLAVSQDYTHTFATAGTYPYHCTNHPSMTGNQVVVSASSVVDSVSVGIIGPGGGPTGTGYSAASVTIRVGGLVHWHNAGVAAHTVTSGS